MDDSDSDAADQKLRGYIFKIEFISAYWTDYVCYVFCRTIIFFH